MMRYIILSSGGVKGKAIGDNIHKMMELINEILTQSKIEDESRIKELIQQFKSRIEMNIFNMGHYISFFKGRNPTFLPTRKYNRKT